MVQKRLWIVYLSLAVLFAILLFICNSIPFSVSGNTLMLIFAIFYLLSLIMAFACSLIAFKGYIETGILTVLLIACALLFYTLSSLMTLEYLHCVINTACLPILFFYWASATFIPLLFFAVSPWQSKIIKSHNARSLIAIFLCIFVSISALLLHPLSPRIIPYTIQHIDPVYAYQLFSIFFVILALIAVAGFHRLYNANPNQIILSFLAASVFILESMLTRYMEPSQGLLDVLELLLLSLGFASLAFGAFIIPRLEKKKNISQ